MLPLRFVGYAEAKGQPHVVVDGSATDGTVLTLSHWPGSPTPPEVLADLSAQIAFAALDRPDWFEGVDLVTNNHFDQDGLVSAWALSDPTTALAQRERAIDLARAGDFGTWEHRDSARLAMAIAACADPERSPLGAASFEAPDPTGLLYRTLLPMLPDLVADPTPLEALWADEDVHLQASLDAIAAGTITVEPDAAADLAVVTVPKGWADRTVNRFTMARTEAVHPMAVNNATDRMVLMVVHDGRIRFEQRYETWVMHPSRPLAPRQDLRDLAARLDAAEGVEGTWIGDDPGDLTPRLGDTGRPTTLSLDRVLAVTREFLATAPPAWDPYPR